MASRPQHQLIVLVFFINCAMWITQCAGDYYSPAQHYDSYYQVPVYYQYSWEVKDMPSGNDYRQQETRDGHLTTGLYQVLYPGGRHQTVNYRVDKDSGFMADVSYQGESNYFTFKSNYQQADQNKNIKASSYKPSAETYSSYEPTYPAAYSRQPAEPSYYPAASIKRPESTYKYPSSQPSESYYYPAAAQPETRPSSSYYNEAERIYPTESPVAQYAYPAAPAITYPPAAATQNYRVSAYDNEYTKSYATSPRPRTTTTTAAPATEPPMTEWSTEPATEPTPAVVNSYESKPDYSVPMYPLYRADFYSARAKAGKSIPEPQGGYAVDDAGTTYIKPSAAYSIPDRLGTYEIKHRKATARKPSQSDYQAPEAIIQSK